MAPGERRASVVRLGAKPTPPVRVPQVRVLVADGNGRRLSAIGLTRWLAQVAPARTRGTISIGLVSDARSRALNKRYRRVDRPTDVLSFPAEANPKSRIPNPKSPLLIGGTSSSS